MKKTLIMVAVGLFLAMTVSGVYAYTAHYGPTETIYYDKNKAFNGYTIFNPLATGTTYLIDMEGNVVHSWALPAGYNICLHARFLENGNLLRGIRNPLLENKYHSQGDGVIQEVRWDGTVEWEVESHPLGRGQHHDFRKIWNNILQEYTYIMIVGKTLPEADAIARGADPSKLGVEGRDGGPDGVIEVNSDGKLIWEWHLVDHTIQDFDPTKLNFGVVADHPEKMDINYGQGLGDGDWQHLNSLDYNQELDQIATNGRSFCEFYVIDHGASFVSTPADFAADFDAAVAANVAAAAGPAGDLIYRFGNPQVYDAAVDFWTEVDHVYSPGDEQMWYSHDIQWIGGANAPWSASELPGGGNFLIYDNGSQRGWESHSYSVVLEINPYIQDETGALSQNYVDPPDAGYSMAGGAMFASPKKQSNQVVWSYQSLSPTSFYSWYISGCERMPNGNTVVCSGAHGHFFEVTYDTKEVVWEYVNPDTPAGPLKLMPDNSGMGGNSVFRCHRFAPDHPAFVGKDLTPMGKITERAGLEALEDKLEAFMAQ
jgi:hypothetical protein